MITLTGFKKTRGRTGNFAVGASLGGALLTQGLGQEAYAELVQISFLSFGMLPGGDMRVLLTDGRQVVLSVSEYTFLDGKLYVDTGTLARVGASSAASVIQASGYGYAGPVFNDPVTTQVGAENSSWWDSTLDFLVSPPILISGGATMIGAGAIGLADTFGFMNNNEDSNDDEDDLILKASGNVSSRNVNEGTNAGHILLSALDGFFENAESSLFYSVTVTSPTGAAVTDVIGLSGNQIVTLSEATDNNAGLYTVVLTAVDTEDGDRATQNFSVLFESDDTAPTVDAGISNQTVQENSAFSFTIPPDAFKDVEGLVTLSVDQTPDGINFDSNTNTFSGTPTVGGSTTIEVTAADSTGKEVSTTFDIVVTNINDAPNLKSGASDPFVISQVGGAAINIGDPFQFELSTLVEDEENDALTFATTSTLPAGYVLSSTGTISGTGASTDTTITVKVTDANNASFDFDVTIDVTGASGNTAPTLTGGASDPYTLNLEGDGGTLDPGDVIYFDLKTIVTDADGDSLTFGSSDIAATGYTLNSSNGILTGVANSNDDTISVDVSDGNGGTLNFALTIDVFGV